MELKKRVPIGLVGGSDLVKILEQMGGNDALSKFDFLFSENGLVAHKAGELMGKMVSKNKDGTSGKFVSRDLRTRYWYYCTGNWVRV